MQVKEKIYVLYRGKKIEFEEEKMKVKEILKKLNLSGEYAFAVRNGEILDENQTVKAGDEIKIVNAISGG
ncbi:MAG: MoaD/ThiS family protein [Candidatus Calescibacterium sp.]|nr:MoaD/ThiS family protein [Candidatus Calescibacterium sp.]MCX7734938.1 MoaD/ThiS family protein [bacterium]MDW8087993.1 MoaD/ThiS family protein [Candidatus Calescibacterium sp.]